jgi:hypothetical protein
VEGWFDKSFYISRIAGCMDAIAFVISDIVICILKLYFLPFFGKISFLDNYGFIGFL